MSKNSANILAFALTVIVLSLVGFCLINPLKINAADNPSLLLSGQCPVGRSFYKKSDLKLAEKAIFSDNAVAYSILGTSSKKYRVVIDYSSNNNLKDRIKVKYYILPDKGNLGDISVQLLINGIENEKSLSDQDAHSDTSVYRSAEANLSNGKNTIGLIIKKKNDCEFKANELFAIDSNNPILKEKNLNVSETTAKTLESANLRLKPGVNYYGSRDWMNFQKLQERGLKTVYYNPTKQAWTEEKEIGEPGRAYAIINSSKDDLEVIRPQDYRVPDDINYPSVAKGWNLLYYNPSNDPPGKMRVYFNSNEKNFISKDSFALLDLVRDGRASSKIYSIERGNLKENDLNRLENFEGPFWFNISSEPKTTARQVNLGLSIIGGGDTYAKGDFIPFKLNILNNDTSSHYLVSSGIADPCQIKLEITDREGKQVFDDLNMKNCPLWPNLEELSPGSKKEYNYTWLVPSYLSGELKVRAYLNYSRLGEDYILDETQVVIK